MEESPTVTIRSLRSRVCLSSLQCSRRLPDGCMSRMLDVDALQTSTWWEDDEDIEKSNNWRM
eukprot:6447506-Pyramimonas_sp.AAC.2